MPNIWIVNDHLTCIPGTRTFWHLLLEIEGTIDKTGTPFSRLAETIENDPGECDLIIRNGTFFSKINKDCKQIVLIQDYYGKDLQQLEVAYNSDHIVFNSDFTRKQLEPWIDPLTSPPNSVIPIGVNQKLFTPHASFKPNNDIFDRFRRTGIFVGDYNNTKNTRLFEAIVRDNTNVDFIYVSKLGHRLNLPNVKNYAGGVDELRMSKLYNEADFCIMCSPVETLHLTTVEAALCDTPVIGTNTGWLTDHFDTDVGIRIDGDPSVDKFSHAIARLLSSTYQPRKHMLKTPFTWDNCKASWEKLIEETLNA